MNDGLAHALGPGDLSGPLASATRSSSVVSGSEGNKLVPLGLLTVTGFYLIEHQYSLALKRELTPAYLGASP